MYSFTSCKKGVEYEIMSALVMLMGLSGSGKSTLAEEYAKLSGGKVFSSDKVREKLFGDENDQTHNGEVFNELHKQIKKALRKNEVCIYDATNLNRNKRISFLRALSDIPCEKICMIVATPIEICIERDQNRSRKVGKKVIYRQATQFQIPLDYEGWDSIMIYKNPNFSVSDYKKLIDYFPKQVMPHDCAPWHTESVQEHLNRTIMEMSLRTNEYYLLLAARYHDIGKFYTKTFYDRSKKMITDKAHYYGHENYGAYLFMTSYDFVTSGGFKQEFEKAWLLIALHMEFGSRNSKVLKEIPKSAREALGLLNECDTLGSIRKEN
nr:MAG TPA: AAA domain protein [Caudoviricetes sp.]